MQYKQVSARHAQFPARVVVAREAYAARNCAVQASQCAARTISCQGSGRPGGLCLPELCSSSKSVRCAHNFQPGQWPPGRIMPSRVVQFKQVSALRAQFPSGAVATREVIPSGIVQFKQVSALRAQFPAGTVATREVMPSGAAVGRGKSLSGCHSSVAATALIVNMFSSYRFLRKIM